MRRGCWPRCALWRNGGLGLVSLEGWRDGGTDGWRKGRKGRKGAYACFLLRRGRRGYRGLVLSVVTLLWCCNMSTNSKIERMTSMYSRQTCASFDCI